MRRVSSLAVAIAALVSSLPAQASDMTAQPKSTWSGPYIGLHAGYGRGDNQWSDFIDPVNPTNVVPGNDAGYDLGGALAGAQIGYNWQVGRVVLGVEADANWSGIDGKGGWPEIPIGCLQEYFCETDVKAFGTIVGRLGVALDDSHLLYAKGGIAWASVQQATGYNIDPDPSLYWWDEPTETRWGWTIGGGMEYAIDRNWSLRAEYNYIDLGNDSTEFVFSPTQTFGVRADADIELHTFNVGINYRFGN